jgi:hypothetical protein
MSLNSGSLSVALLVADIIDAKKIGHTFRSLGVIPHVYDDLGEFWSGVLEQMPTVAMIDVRMMSEGDLLLKNHPHIKSGELPITFLYSERTKPLLNSAHSIFNLGLINCDQALSGQIKNILRRVNRINHLENLLSEKRSKLERADAKLENLMVSSRELLEKEHYQQQLQELIIKITSMIGQEDNFTALCGKVFSEMDEVVEFTILKLSRSGQKLLSPQIKGEKFRSIPALWLGDSYSKGIELLGQNMASQVISDLMDGELISLAIQGQHHAPDVLVYLRTGSITFMNKFDWAAIETLLTSANRYYRLIAKEQPQSISRTITPWHAMTLLDQYSITAGDGEWDNEQLVHISMDMSDIHSTAVLEVGGKFFWADFYREFLRQLDKQGDFDYRVTSSGVQQISFLVESEDSELFKRALQQLLKGFSFWRYFENGEKLLTTKIQPAVRDIPLSARAYLNHQHALSKAGEKPVTLKNSALRRSVAPVISQ